MRKRFLCLGLALALVGCAATKQQASSVLGQRYNGQNIDQMVLAFGPPKSSFKLSDGRTAYQWQIANHTNVDDLRRNTVYCKVRAVAGTDHIVQSISTEDAANILGESLCAERLRLTRFKASTTPQ